MKNPKYVYVSDTKTIGVILDKGLNPNGSQWFRTDCDGIRESNEMLFLYTKKDVLECLNQLNANIAPSTKKIIGI